jgi:hypothetical protein
MTARVFGEENKPKPMPRKVNLRTMSPTGDAAFSCDNRSNPAVTITMPTVLSDLEPNLSASQPLGGERSAIATDMAIRNTPALSG